MPLVYLGMRRPETRDHGMARGDVGGDTRQKIRLSLIFGHQTLFLRDDFPFHPFTLSFSLDICSIASILSVTTS